MDLDFKNRYNTYNLIIPRACCAKFSSSGPQSFWNPLLCSLINPTRCRKAGLTSPALRPVKKQQAFSYDSPLRVYGSVTRGNVSVTVTVWQDIGEERNGLFLERDEGQVSASSASKMSRLLSHWFFFFFSRNIQYTIHVESYRGMRSRFEKQRFQSSRAINYATSRAAQRF